MSNQSVGDNSELSPYGQAMEGGLPYIRLKLDVPGVIELGAFVGAFTALANEYDRFMRADQARNDNASLYVGEVRHGSIIAVLLPVVVGALPDLAAAAGQVLDLEEFVRRYAARLGRFLGSRNPQPSEVTKAELRDFAEQVAAIANAPNASIEIAAIEIEEGEHRVTAEPSTSEC